MTTKEDLANIRGAVQAFQTISQLLQVGRFTIQEAQAIPACLKFIEALGNAQVKNLQAAEEKLFNTKGKTNERTSGKPTSTKKDFGKKTIKAVKPSTEKMAAL